MRNKTSRDSRVAGAWACVAACVMTAANLGAAAPRMSQNHVPASLEGVRLFSPKAASRNHIALVNVGGAIPEEDWRLAATYAASRLQLNLWTNAIAASATDRLLADPAAVGRVLGNEHAKVGVFFERRGAGCGILAAPGAWCVVDVSSLTRDAPDKQTLRDRYAKMILKGLAAAAGGGATLEPFCSMFYGAQTLSGMDRTNIALAPMCYFPMIEILRHAGGHEMAFPAGSDADGE